MLQFRTYGQSPYTIVLIHGGPGVPGSLKPLAEELSQRHSVIEAMQSISTIAGQIEELKTIINKNCITRVILVGHSWGAWLGCLVAAEYPELVKKLILISAAAFEPSYLNSLLQTRLNRILSGEDSGFKNEWNTLISKKRFSDKELRKFGKLVSKADTYKAISAVDHCLKYQSEVFHSIWKEADELRMSGQLLEIVSNIKCQVTAIHGDYDSHPWQGVKEPLEKTLANFKFHLLEKCGHEPWNEYFAKEKFYLLLNKDIMNTDLCN